MHVGGEPGKGRQAAEAVTVEEGQGADIRAQRGHGAHSSPSPADRRKGRRWPPTPALTDGAAPRRSPPRRFKPHQLASHGPRQSQRTSQRQRTQGANSSKEKRPGRLGGCGQLLALCPLLFLGLGAPGLYKDLISWRPPHRGISPVMPSHSPESTGPSFPGRVWTP